MNPLRPEVPKVTWQRLIVVFSVGFLLLQLVRWGFADGSGWLLVLGSLVVLGIGAALFGKMRIQEEKNYRRNNW